MKKNNLLLIMPNFFGYERKIYKEFSKRYNVTVLYENIEKLSFVSKIIKLYSVSAQRKFINKSILKKLNTIVKHHYFDYCLVIRGTNISNEHIELIKNNFPSIRLIMYQWDSIENNPNAKLIAHQFNTIYTFDPDDAKRENWKYRPLFFSFTSDVKEKKYDLCFIATLHSNRYDISVQLDRLTKKSKMIIFSHLYISFFSFLKQKYLVRSFKFKRKYINFTSLSLKKTNTIYAKSKIVVDYTHPKQKGLTMRTIEALGNNCKIVTNNENIKNEPFYTEENIFIYKDDVVNIPNSFISSYEVSYDNKIVQRYSLESFCNELLK